MKLFVAQPAWVASRFEDIRTLLTDPQMNAKEMASEIPKLVDGLLDAMIAVGPRLDGSINISM